MYMQQMGSGHFSPGHVPLETLPRTIFPPVLHSIERFPLTPPFAVLKRFIVNMYKIDRGRSVRVSRTS